MKKTGTWLDASDGSGFWFERGEDGDVVRKMRCWIFVGVGGKWGCGWGILEG